MMSYLPKQYKIRPKLHWNDNRKLCALATVWTVPFLMTFSNSEVTSAPKKISRALSWLKCNKLPTKTFIISGCYLWVWFILSYSIGSTVRDRWNHICSQCINHWQYLAGQNIGNWEYVYILPILLHGADTWSMTMASSRRLDALDQWCLRRIVHIPYMAHITNEEVRHRTGQSPELS